MQKTRLICLALGASLGTGALPLRAAETRSLSLQDCFQAALQHNLEVQISRVNPRLAELTLANTYSAYDPAFRGSYRHDSSSTPGGVDEQARPYSGSTTTADNFDLGISGLLPTGTSYGLGLRMNDTYGNRGSFRIDPATGVPIFTPVFGFDGLPIGYFATTNYTGFLPEVDPFENANASLGINLTQPLLKNFWIDGARLNIAIRKKDLQVSELLFQLQLMRTVTEVTVAYYNLIAANEYVTVMRQALEQAEQQLRENRKRVEVGVMAPLEEKDAESQVAASRANVLAAENSLTIAQNQLKALLTDEYQQWQDVIITPTERLSDVGQTFSRQDSWAKAMTLRPDLLQLRIDLEKRDIRLKYDRNQLYPQLDLVGSYGMVGTGSEFSGALSQVVGRDNPTWSVGTILSIPLSNRQARYNYRLSKEEKEQALLSLKKREQDIMLEIDDAISRARSSLEQYRARKEASGFAQAAFEAEQKKLENGKSTSFQVLVLQRLLTERRYAELSALADYNRSLADLALKEGTTLEANRIQVEVR